MLMCLKLNDILKYFKNTMDQNPQKKKKNAYLLKKLNPK